MSKLITCFEVAAFFASLAAWPVLRNSRYLRVFPFILGMIAVVEVSQSFFKSYFSYYNTHIYNIETPIEHGLYLLILYRAISHERWKKFLMFSGIVFLAFAVMTTLYFTKPNHSNILAYSLGSVLIITGILLKFYEMLENPQEFNFLRNPFFYMLFACLLFNVATLPFFIMMNWMYYIEAGRKIHLVFASVMTVFNCVLYLTYTITFLWMILKKRPS